MSENTNEQVTSILFCGVGGQGVLLASNLTTAVALEAGMDVKKTEVHGMAQRGGNVDSHVRFGKTVHSPIIPQGEVNFILALEQVEPLRWAHMGTKDTWVISNTQKIHSLFTGTGIAEYPEGAQEEVKRVFPNTIYVDALKLAEELGNARTVNVILLGVMARKMDFELEHWQAAIKKNMKPKLVDLNLKAFETGWNYAG